MSGLARRHTARLTALALVALASLWLTTARGGSDYSSHELAAMASKFRFEQRGLATASRARHRSVYPVVPQLHKIRSWISALGASVVITDANGDGLAAEVCLVDPRTGSVTVSAAPGSAAGFKPFLLDPKPLPYDARTMTPMGCAPGDFDEDGTTDFLVSFGGRSPVMFLRRPGTRLGPRAFVRQELMSPRQLWTATATVTKADVDGDGHLDLLVGNYWPDGLWLLGPRPRRDPARHAQDSFSRANNGGGPRILLWQSARRGRRPAAHFREVNPLPRRIAHGWTVAIGAADLNGDLLPDIYIANDFGPDRLLVNESTPGHVKLTSVTGKRGFTTPASKVLGKDSFKSMSAAIGDLTGDGRLDIFVTNITTNFGLHESNLVWVNTGGPLKAGATAPFVERSEELGMARSGWGWDAKIGDFSNDGTPEVVHAAGFIKGTKSRWPEMHELAMGNDTLTQNVGLWPRYQPGDDLAGDQKDVFFAQGPDGRYADLASRVGLDAPMLTRGIALGDVNRDGRLDFALANQWGPSYLYLNRSPRRAFLGLKLVLPPAGRRAATKVLPSPRRGTPAQPAIGAIVTVRLPGGRRLVQQVDGGNGHAGVSAPELLFGLGDHPPRRVVADVAWRDGTGLSHRASLPLRPGWHTVRLEQR